MQEEVRRLREEIDELNTSIKYVQTSHICHRPYDIHNTQLFMSPVTSSSQLLSGTAACDRGARQAASTEPHAREVQ